MNRVRVSTFAVEKKQVLSSMFVCLYSSLSYQAYKAHAPYYIAVCAQSDSTTLLHITSYYDKTFGKGMIIKCGLIFSTACLKKNSHSKYNSSIYYRKCTQLFLSDFKETRIF